MRRVIVGAVLLALVVAGMAVIGGVNTALKSTCTHAVLPLEITPSIAVAKNIVDDWSAKGALDAARKGTYIDFAFIVVYSITFWFFCRWAGDALAPYDERWPVYGRAFGRAGVLAGALDFFVENPGLLLEMNGRYYCVVTVIKALGASIKWVLILLVFAFLISSWITWLRIWRDKTKSGDPRQFMPE